MRITGISLRDFRNYEHFDLPVGKRITVLIGPNAAGKTNAIEAIRLLTAGSSFRRPRWDELVRHGSQVAVARLHAQGQGRSIDVALTARSDGTHSFSLNGKTSRASRGIAGVIPSVVFTPDDLGLVKGPAEYRRAELDDIGDQLSATYSRLRREYDRIVRQRNRLLKDSAADTSELAVWDERLVALGSRLRMHRARLVGRLASEAEPFHKRVCPGEHLDVVYAKGRAASHSIVRPDTTAEAEAAGLRVELDERREEETARQMTLAGPHRDDVEFAVNGRRARSFASQGQTRTIVLAWKMAELAVTEELTGGDAVLLLDDVMSELDARRRRALTAEVGERVQTFITATTTAYFDPDLLRDASVVAIGGGEDG